MESRMMQGITAIPVCKIGMQRVCAHGKKKVRVLCLHTVVLDHNSRKLLHVLICSEKSRNIKLVIA